MKRCLLFFLVLNMTNSVLGFTHLTQSDIASHSKLFRQYLTKLGWEVSVPWPVILTTAKALGLSQVEIDAIPVSFPFLYEEKYKTVFDLLETSYIIDQINALIEKFETQVGHLSPAKRRQLLHQLIHELMIKELGLPAATTTKELAKIVAKGTLSIRRLCEVQLIAFFVKYYLKI